VGEVGLFNFTAGIIAEWFRRVASNALFAEFLYPR